MLFSSQDITDLYNLEFFIFIVGLAGIVFNRKNIILNILAIEMLLLAVNLNLATGSLSLDDVIGQIFIIFILAIAAAETSIGLSLTSAFYRLGHLISMEPLIQLNLK